MRSVLGGEPWRREGSGGELLRQEGLRTLAGTGSCSDWELRQLEGSRALAMTGRGCEGQGRGGRRVAKSLQAKTIHGQPSGTSAHACEQYMPHGVGSLSK